MWRRKPREIDVTRPCSKEWDELLPTGDSKRRHCEDCGLSLIDVSVMTRREARRAVDGEEGRVCIAVLRDRQGVVQHRPGRVTKTLTAVRRCCYVAAVAIAGLLFGWAERNDSGVRAYRTEHPTDVDCSPSRESIGSDAEGDERKWVRGLGYHAS